MQPNGNPQQPLQSDPYAFLNETSVKKNRFPGLGGGGSSKSTHILLIVFLLLFIVLAIAGLKALLSGGNGLNLPSLQSVLVEQQEIISLASSGTSQATQQSTLNLSYTILATLTTDQNNLSSLLTKNGHTINLTSFTPQANLANQLTQTQQTSAYNPLLISILQSQLKIYQYDLSNAYNLNKSSVIRQFLSTDFKNSKLLQQAFNYSVG